MTVALQHPLISVCIANFNGMEVIDECLRSVQDQAGDLSVEIIVHDDASTDGSADYIRASHPDVELLESAENVGFCISNNRMVERARGEYILLLNLSSKAPVAKSYWGNPRMAGLPIRSASFNRVASLASGIGWGKAWGW